MIKKNGKTYLTTQELLTRLQSLPDTDYEADIWLGGPLFSTHLLRYSSNQVFDMVLTDNNGAWQSFTDWLELYADRWWMLLQ